MMDSFIRGLMKHHDIPGVSLAIVHKGSVICTNGYGVLTDMENKRDAKSNQVNAQTCFCIGSLTKAFTAAIWAQILQDEKGKGWDTPLKDLGIRGAPVFSDDFRSTHVCLRDILAHKLGIELGESDFGWVCDAFPSTYHLMKNTKHIPLSADFRSKMMYNNYMYAIAGYMSDLIKGESWESMVSELFQILGMDTAGFIHQPGAKSRIATPHMAVRGHSIPVNINVHKAIGKLAAAGSIYASAADMAKWLLFQLNKGKIGDTQVIEKRWFEECHKPQFALPNGKPEWYGYVHKPQFPATETRDAYGFGWWTGTYREYATIAHAGELFGFDSLITMLPDADLGIYTCFNGPGGEAAHVGNQLMHYYIIDQLLDLKPWLSIDSAITFPLPWQDNKNRYFPPKENTQIEHGIQSNRPLLCFRGTYSHPFLGDIDISLPKAHTRLCMNYGRSGKFTLHPNGVDDEFRMEGIENLQFVHQVDLYSPSDWMTVHFYFDGPHSERACKLYCAWFESAPAFERVDS